jgi:polysaccharide pyruvyl transferase WcaK-like protein
MQNMMPNRREFLATSLAALILSSGMKLGSKPKILLRSSWQTVNIGDIGHTPGVLTLLEKHLPEAELWHWPSSLDQGVDELLRTRFPNLVIVQKPEDVKRAFAECDFFLHGSGASLVAQKNVQQWHDETKKPFGIWGITIPTFTPQLVALLNQAQFLFCRDTISLQKAREAGVNLKHMDFGPDGAFNVDLRDDEPAEKFLKENNLEHHKFLCCIPRLRYTPYWLIKKGRKFEEDKNTRNEEMKEHDHAPLREAICEVIRKTDHKILLCPEDMTQMQVSKEMIYDKLPDDVKPRVVWRKDYWLTGEAISTYVRSSGLFGLEMHSPIMCIGNGVPAIVCRFDEQTTKGFMWRDIGLGDWLFDMDKPDEVAKLSATVLSFVTNPKETQDKAKKAWEVVQNQQNTNLQILRECVKLT